MDIDFGNSGSTYACLCGRTFSQSSALSYHKRSCKPSKRRLDGALEKAKEVWDAKKKRRVEAIELGRKNSSSETTGGADVSAHVVGDMPTYSAVDNATTEVWKLYKITHICC